MGETKTALVTGGGGFLGFALLKALKERGFALRTINRGVYPELSKLGITVYQGDLADYQTALEAMRGVDVVFHVAAKPGVWGPYREYYEANVQATANIIQACQELGIPKLIYTSSPSVTFGGEDQVNVDESTPYPKEFLAAYPATKAQAEQLVLATNSQALATVALRPHLIWGPGDRHLIPRIVERGRAGRLRLIGDGSKLVDAVYIDNAVEAHLCAWDRLAIGSPIAGKAYFIGNAEPWPMKDILNSILKAAELPPVTKSVSPKAALRIATAIEAIYTFFRIKKEPALTRFTVAQLSTAHWYNPQAAREELGYRPKVSMAEGFERLAQSMART